MTAYPEHHDIHISDKLYERINQGQRLIIMPFKTQHRTIELGDIIHLVDRLGQHRANVGVTGLLRYATLSSMLKGVDMAVFGFPVKNESDVELIENIIEKQFINEHGPHKTKKIVFGVNFQPVNLAEPKYQKKLPTKAVRPPSMWR